MKATEFRIGNLIIEGRIIDLSANMHLTVRNDSGEDERLWCSRIKPIPLTEEWLEKLGFEIEWDDDGSGDYDYVKKNGRFLFVVRSQDKFSVYQQRDVGLHYEPLSPGINYVHQLQNLYFALTGEELIIK